jgi:hypothetical protein
MTQLDAECSVAGCMERRLDGDGEGGLALQEGLLLYVDLVVGDGDVRYSRSRFTYDQVLQHGNQCINHITQSPSKPSMQISSFLTIHITSHVGILNRRHHHHPRPQSPSTYTAAPA